MFYLNSNLVRGNMSTVIEVRNMYNHILDKYVNSDVSRMIMRYVYIVADDECEWCCDENCEILELSKDNWVPFKVLCGEEYNHTCESLTKDEFEERYNGYHVNMADFAYELCEDCEYDSLGSLPWYIKNHINWDLVWDDLSVDYDDYSNHIFRHL